MALFLLIFAVCAIVIGSAIALMMMVRTPRYRTEPRNLLRLFERILSNQASEAEWHAMLGYPVRHDHYLEEIRRSAQRIMDDHGRPPKLSRDGSLLSRSGREELTALRDHLAAHATLQEGQREF